MEESERQHLTQTMPIEAKLLLGWMTRETALIFLTRECIPQMTEQEAETLWTQYKDRVNALPAEESSPAQPLSKAERHTKEMFLRHCYQQKKHDIEDVIKLDLANIPIRQFRIIAPRSKNYESQVTTRAGWASRSLPTSTQEPNLQGRYSQTGTTTEAWFEIPHAEFLFPLNPDSNGLHSFQVRQGDRWVTTTRLEQSYVLWAGYHRSLARLVNTIGDASERSALMALTRTRLFDTPNQAPEEAHARVNCLLARPPFLKDFLDERLCMTVNLRKQKFFYHVKGEVVATEDAS